MIETLRGQQVEAQMSHECTEMTVTAALHAFMTGKTELLSRRARRNYEDVLELIDEYLANHGVTSIDFVTSPARHPKADTAGVDRVLALLDDFEDDYLIAELEAEREFLRVAEYVIRDVVRWLRGRWIRRPRQIEAVA